MITNVKIVDARYKSRIGGDQFSFQPGINILAGPNGCGKTSLIEAIKHEIEIADSTVARIIRDASVPVTFYSGEVATVKLSHKASASDGDMTARHESHGQGLRAYLESLRNIDGEHVVVMDEPETALDFFAVADLCQTIAMKSDTVQFIISSHHPLVFTMKNANTINMSREEGNYANRVLQRLKKRLN